MNEKDEKVIAKGENPAENGRNPPGTGRNPAENGQNPADTARVKAAVTSFNRYSSVISLNMMTDNALREAVARLEQLSDHGVPGCTEEALRVARMAIQRILNEREIDRIAVSRLVARVTGVGSVALVDIDGSSWKSVKGEESEEEEKNG